MQDKSPWENITARINNILNNSLVVLFASSCLLGVFTLAVNALPKPESPKDAIEVKGFKWKSGGMGTAGIIKEITLDNKGKMTYKNIEIEVNLYSTNDIPLGSLRSTIHDVLEGGSEKTFYDVNFGIMHSELQKTVFRVTGAELVEKGPPSLPKDLILVKNWEWSGGQYGTEGILKEITLENRSESNYKDIKIVVGNLGVGGPDKVGYEGYTSRAVIHDVLPSKSTKTFKEINVGFRHPDTRESYISVIDAKLVSAKELRYRLAEKGEPVKKRTKKVAKNSSEERTVKAGENQAQVEEKTISEQDSKLTLAERYRQKLAQKTEETSTTPQSPETAESSGKISMETEPQEKEIASASSEEKKTVAKEAPEKNEAEEESTSEDGIIGKVSKFGKSIVGIFKGDSQKIEEETEEAELSPSNKEESTEGEATTVREIPEEEEEEEVAIPKDDILVKDFKWGGGITGTIGILEEITLENRSGINYRNIQLKVDFYAGSDRRPLGSNKFTIYAALPANSEKVFRNVKIGFLNSIPEDVVIRVVDAAAVR